MSPTVTAAMLSSRPEKSTVRDEWLTLLKEYEGHWSEGEVLYTTLCGAEAFDIRMMVDAGLIKTTEVGGIDARDAHKVVAVESSLDAVRQIRQLLPGIKVVDKRIEYIAGGASDPNSFPARKGRDAARARVLNLDFNGRLKLDYDAQSGFVHPDLETVRKIVHLHGKPDIRAPWCLFLTFQAEITWNLNTQRKVFRYLAENATSNEVFGGQLKRHCGDELYSLITDSNGFDISTRTRQDQQFLLSAFVPKRVAQLASLSGWRVATRANWRYGGDNQTAPMCTWIFDFIWDVRGDSNANAVYQDSLNEVLNATAVVDSRGAVISDGLASQS